VEEGGASVEGSKSPFVNRDDEEGDDRDLGIAPMVG
jgi:hypothetical protein